MSETGALPLGDTPKFEMRYLTNGGIQVKKKTGLLSILFFSRHPLRPLFNPSTAGGGNPFDHAVKDEMMGGEDGIPVKNAGQASREKAGSLLQAEYAVADLW